MSTPGKSSVDRRSRPARVAPRRHVDVVTASDGGSYDSNEFPVLLRMPDVSQTQPVRADVNSTTREDDRKAAREVTREVVQREPLPPAEPTRRHRADEPGSLPAATKSVHEAKTRTADARFWSTIPPQLAAGGMLLAVITLCFILLRDSGPAVEVQDNKADWANDFDTEATPKVAEKPETPGNDTVSKAPAGDAVRSAATGEHAPPAPQFTVVPFTASGNPTTPTTAPANQAGGWPSGDVAVAPLSEEDSQPVQGWPDFSEGPTNGAAIESAERPTAPGLRTSQRPTITLPSLGSSDMPRNGTIDIPPPTKIYRQ